MTDVKAPSASTLLKVSLLGKADSETLSTCRLETPQKRLHLTCIPRCPSTVGNQRQGENSIHSFIHQFFHFGGRAFLFSFHHLSSAAPRDKVCKRIMPCHWEKKLTNSLSILHSSLFSQCKRLNVSEPWSYTWWGPLPRLSLPLMAECAAPHSTLCPFSAVGPGGAEDD